MFLEVEGDGWGSFDWFLMEPDRLAVLHDDLGRKTLISEPLGSG